MKKRKHVGEENVWKRKKKIKVEQSKRQKEKFIQPHLPKTAEDISANWKALSVVLAENKKKDNRPEKSSLPHNGRRKTSMKHKNVTKRNLTEDTATKKSKSNEEIWFDDVDPEDILRASGSELQQKVKEKQIASESNAGGQHLQLITGGYEGISKHVAIDCEMVGVGINGQEHMLARVSIVNIHGHVIYDKYVAPRERVIDYRTPISGIRPANLKDAPDFKAVQQEVFDALKDKILVGHAIKNDLKVLFLDHPHKNIRDTSKYKPFQKAVKSKKPSLKKLAKVILGMDIQSGEHCSVQDAQVTMRLYSLHKKEWERKLKQNKMRGKKETLSTFHSTVVSTTKDHETEYT